MSDAYTTNTRPLSDAYITNTLQLSDGYMETSNNKWLKTAWQTLIDLHCFISLFFQREGRSGSKFLLEEPVWQLILLYVCSHRGFFVRFWYWQRDFPECSGALQCILEFLFHTVNIQFLFSLKSKGNAAQTQRPLDAGNASGISTSLAQEYKQITNIQES